jgi:hypothetical protein
VVFHETRRFCPPKPERIAGRRTVRKHRESKLLIISGWWSSLLTDSPVNISISDLDIQYIGFKVAAHSNQEERHD